MAWLTGWNKRKEIRYGTVIPDANLDDFPKLFKDIDDDDIQTELGGGGGIAITEADGETLVPFGLYPSWTLLIWGRIRMRAKFSTLLTAASTGDVLGYIYYDSGQSTTEDKAGTVDNGYALFMPLEEDPSGSSPQMYDWVTEANLGASSGSMTSGDLVASQVGDGLDFDGSDDKINCGHAANLNLTGNLTLECWVKPGDTTTDYRPLIGKEDWANSKGYYLGLNPAMKDGGIYFGFNRGGNEIEAAASTVSTGNWYYLSGVFNGSGLVIYKNGASVATGGSSTAPTGHANDFFIAYVFTAADQNTTAILDEVRVSSTDRAAEWISYTYDDEANNADTFTLGDEETEGAAGHPAVKRMGGVAFAAHGGYQPVTGRMQW